MSEPTIEQCRAAAAWQNVKQVKGKDFAREYKTLAQGAPADIQTSGLGQTLAFWYAKGEPAHKSLLGHLSAWVLRQMGAAAEDSLLHWVMRHNSDEYRRATREALAYLVWIKRFAEAELDDGQIRAAG